MSINTVELGPGSKNNLKSIERELCKIKESVSNIPVPTQRTPNRDIIPAGTTGTIPAGYRSFTVTNIGVTDVLLDGVALASGRSNTFNAGGDDTLANMTYNTQLSSIEILTIT